MAWVPRYFQASTAEIAQQALVQGLLKYPAICYVEQGNYLIWVTEDGSLTNVGGYDQITGVEYKDGIISFMCGNRILFAANIGSSTVDVDKIKDEIIKGIGLDSYIKAEDAVKLINNRIGDLGEAPNVVEYLKSISYDTIQNTPIKNEYGSLTKTIVVANLADGVYRVSGQYKIGGDYQTIQMSSDDSIFLVSRNSSDNSINITQLLGNTIKLYSIDSTGLCTADRYITEDWINDKDFISSAQVKEYVKELVGQSIAETVDTVLDEKLEAKLAPIPDENIMSIFK